jgi:hypothetical protein
MSRGPYVTNTGLHRPQQCEVQPDFIRAHHHMHKPHGTALAAPLSDARQEPRCHTHRSNDLDVTHSVQPGLPIRTCGILCTAGGAHTQLLQCHPPADGCGHVAAAAALLLQLSAVWVHGLDKGTICSRLMLPPMFAAGASAGAAAAACVMGCRLLAHRPAAFCYLTPALSTAALVLSRCFFIHRDTSHLLRHTRCIHYPRHQ